MREGSPRIFKALDGKVPREGGFFNTRCNLRLEVNFKMFAGQKITQSGAPGHREAPKQGSKAIKSNEVMFGDSYRSVTSQDKNRKMFSNMFPVDHKQ